MTDTKDLQTTSDNKITMAELKEVILDTLRDGIVVNIATARDNQPWVAAMIYVYDQNFNLYWLTRETTRHSEEIADNPKVAANITAVQENGRARQLQITGEAHMCENQEISVQIEDKYHERHKEFKNKSLEELASEVKRYKLYKLETGKIFVTHEALWGHERLEYTP